jgi:hypothetical protein
VHYSPNQWLTVDHTVTVVWWWAQHWAQWYKVNPSDETTLDWHTGAGSIGTRREVRVSPLPPVSLPAENCCWREIGCPGQVEEMAERFNALYRGNLEKRRDIAFLPAGPNGKSVQFVPTKEPLLKPDIYDQLVRFACAEFSVPSVPFEKPMNRASAQEAGEQAQVAGLEPDIAWLAELINRIIKNDLYFGLKGYTFTFGPRRDVDAKTQMEVDTGYAKCAILTVDEIRDELGKEPFNDVKEASQPGVMTPNNGFIPLSSADAQPILAARQKQTV